jgi:general secretion pathway protein A
MYTEYYGLRTKAFSKTPDPRFLFTNEAVEEALLQLLYAVEEREIGLLLGPVGSGKTLLTRVLMDRLDGRHEVALLVHPSLTPSQLLESVAAEFGVTGPLPPGGDRVTPLQDRLLELDRAGRVPVLIVDEAHLIPSRAVFEEIRLLMNFQMDDRNLLSVILVGQPELKRRLRHRCYQSLVQRIGAEFELGPMGPGETGAYLEHRLREAGSSSPGIFTAGACAALHRASRGLPRVLNHLATQCLLEGMARGRMRIDAATAQRVVRTSIFFSRAPAPDPRGE